jgi:hypothetical protein
LRVQSGCFIELLYLEKHKNYKNAFVYSLKIFEI